MCCTNASRNISPSIMNSPDPFAELHALCDRLIDGDFSPADRERLEQLVLGDARLKQRYVELRHEHAALRELAGTLREQPPAELLRVEADAPRVGGAFAWNHMRRWLPIAAALVVGSAFWWFITPRPQRPLATLVESTNASWGSSSLPTAAGSSLPAGRLRLEAGMARIVFQSGAEVRLEGPAEFELVGRNAGFLHAGVLTAHVPESAHGFSVGTANAQLIDHGTDFGLSAPGSGPAQVRVISGEVELRHERSGQSLRLNTREGARITAAQFMTAQSPDSEPALYPVPPHDEALPGGENTITLSSAAGRGDAAYVASPNSNLHHSDTLLLLKNHSADARHQRKACIRFDLAPLGNRRVQDATLTLNFESTGLGYASLTDACTFAVYGLLDDAQDNWSSAAMAWETFPAFSDDPGRVDMSRATKLGTFVLPRGVVAGTYGISGDTLARFLNADANRQATLIVVRETVLGANTAVHGFAGNRHPTLAPPSLRITFAP
jgi:anti-sigma factor RsiW